MTMRTAPSRPKRTLEEWVNETAEETEDPYRYLDRDIEEWEVMQDLLGRRES